MEEELILNEPQPEVNNINENLADNNSESETSNKLLTKTDIIQLLKNLLTKEGKDIQRDEISKLKQTFLNLRKEEIEKEKELFVQNGNNEDEFTPSTDPLEQELLIIISDLKQKKTVWIEERERILKENLDKKNNIIEQITKLAENTDTVNRSYNEFKELAEQFRAIGDIPQEATTDNWRRFQDAEQYFYDQLKINQELRDYDFKKNLEKKLDIISKANKLVERLSKLKDISQETEDIPQNQEDAQSDTLADEMMHGEQIQRHSKLLENKSTIVDAFKELQELHSLWKLTGPVAKEYREDIWQKFHDVSTIINKQYQAFFEEKKAIEKANEKVKKALCEEIKNIDFTLLKKASDWEHMTKNVIDLQKKWKEVGFSSRKADNVLFAEFRTACDDFFNLKGKFFSQLKEQQASNIEKKTELVLRAEQLMDSTDWNKTAKELTKLQSDWKDIGPLPRKQSDELWERFHNACDKFFNERKRNFTETRQSERENLKRKNAIISQLRDLEKIDDVDEIKERFTELQKEFREIGFVPFKDKDRISEDYRTAVNSLRKKFNINGQKNSFEKFKNDICEFESDNNKLMRERDKLYRMLENKRSDYNTYTNNMGFLSARSKNADGLVKEIEHKIDLIKSDINDLEERIRFIDSKLR